MKKNKAFISVSHNFNLSTQDLDYSIQVELLNRLTIDYDSLGVNNLLNGLYNKLGMTELYRHIIMPFLIKIGEMWQLGLYDITHEHFFSNLLRTFIIQKTSFLPENNINKTALLFLPNKEEHELSLLIYNYLIIKKGWKSVYLGQKVPIETIEKTYKQLSPELIITSSTQNISEKKFKKLINELISITGNKKLYINGANSLIYAKSLPKKVKTIHSLSDFEAIFIQK